MVVIYTSHVSPRLKYIFKQIFERILKIDITLTSVIEEFIAHNGPKINYSKTPFSDEFFIRSHELLFEQGINDLEIIMGEWEELPCFFLTNKKSVIPFDIFAASFYLITRYEEYLPQLRDEHDRYPFKESLAFMEGFLDRPLVDAWAFKFGQIFQEAFPEYNRKPREVVLEATINVDLAFKFLKKGGLRTFGGFLRDLSKFRLREIWRRFLVLCYLKKDPYDTYDTLIAYQRMHNIPTTFFYLISPYSTFDKNISFTKHTYSQLVKSNSDYSGLGLLASYYSVDDLSKLAGEKRLLEEVTHWNITKSRQYYTRLKLPEIYQNAIDTKIQEDYSMGYEEALGFRASTCTPFYFYDLDFEIQTPLRVVPYCFSDRYFLKRRISPSLALESIKSLYAKVEPFGGHFVLFFHSDTFSVLSGNQSWKRTYEDLLIYLKKE